MCRFIRSLILHIPVPTVCLHLYTPERTASFPHTRCPLFLSSDWLSKNMLVYYDVNILEYNHFA